MPTKVLHQLLPSSGEAREALRDKGQFWTPDWVAEAMVEYILIDNVTDHIFDPGVGAGAFFRAAKKLAKEYGKKIKFLGRDIDPEVLREAEETGLTKTDLAGVEIRDFVMDPPSRKYQAIVANPPYIRHHRLSGETKTYLREFTNKMLGFHLDGRAGFHVYFFLRALGLLEKGGKLTFIMPADTAEGVFASKLWVWVTDHFRLDAIATFSSEATPFPQVDTNAVIFFISNNEPSKKLKWSRCKKQNSDELRSWVKGGFRGKTSADLDIHTRTLAEALRTGLSRQPAGDEIADLPTLGDFARTMRGIATGANEFFLLTKQQVLELRLPENFFVRVVARTRDATGTVIDRQTLRDLDAKGRPTLLLTLDGRGMDELPKSVQEYLRVGERMGLAGRALIATRRPWYKMELRKTPTFLFAYLGRRNARFIRNEAKIIPLTGFLCVYPKSNDTEQIEALWRVLSHPKTVANLSLVGKSYGDGAIKVEPRALERLPIPIEVIKESGLLVRRQEKIMA